MEHFYTFGDSPNPYPGCPLKKQSSADENAKHGCLKEDMSTNFSSGKSSFISIVIPLYNKEDSIQRAIHSVLKQTYKEYELLLIDDSSTDLSLERVQKIHDERIRIITQNHSGVSKARNRGVQEAKYEFVAFLDADDEWDENYLSEIILLMTEYPNCRLYASSFREVNTDKSIVIPGTPYKKNASTIIGDVFHDFRMYYPFFASSVMVNKATLIKAGGFPEDVRAGEDVVTWMKMGLASEIAYVNKPLVTYHKDAENRASTMLPPDEVYAPVRYLMDWMSKKDIPNKYHHSAIEYIAKHQLTAVKRNIRCGKPWKAVELLWTCKGTKEQRSLWLKLLIISIAALFSPNLGSKILTPTHQGKKE